MADLEEIMAGGGTSMPEAGSETQTHEQTPPAADPNLGQPQGNEPPANPEEDADPVTGLRKALDAERGKGRKYKETVEQLERRLEAMQSQMTGFMTAFQSQQRPQQPQEQPQPVDLWDDPTAFVGTHVQQALNPVQEALMFNAKLVAESRHTPEKVSEAEQAFLAAVNSRQLDPRDYDKVINSPNRYHAAVEWYNNRPESQREQMRAEILAELGIQPGQPAPQQQQQPVPSQPQAMPTSFAAARNNGPRTTPQWSGPQALSDIMKR